MKNNLRTIPGVGKAIADDLERLGISSVQDTETALRQLVHMTLSLIARQPGVKWCSIKI